MAAKSILITAAGGHIGEELIPQLLALQPPPKLVLPTSNASRLKSKLSLPAGSDVAVEEGSIKDPNWFQSLLVKHRVDTVFLCLTGNDELFTTMNCLDAMRRSQQVKKLIYLSACFDASSHEAFERILGGHGAAHVVVKPLVEQVLRSANFPFSHTVLGPTLFFINDLRSKNAMLEQGLFDEPLGERGVSRVAPSDIALAVKNVAIDSTGRWNGQKISIGSKQAYAGKEVTRIWSEALGKDIRMLPADDEGLSAMEHEYGSRIGGDVGAAWGRDLRLMYEYFAEHGFPLPEEDYRSQVELLGKEAEDYEAWVKTTAASWL